MTIWILMIYSYYCTVFTVRYEYHNFYMRYEIFELI
jgi:hypothetical protein